MPLLEHKHGRPTRVGFPSRELPDCDEWTIILLSVLVFVVVAGCPVRTAPPTRREKACYAEANQGLRFPRAGGSPGELGATRTAMWIGGVESSLSAHHGQKPAGSPSGASATSAEPFARAASPADTEREPSPECAKPWPPSRPSGHSHNRRGQRRKCLGTPRYPPRRPFMQIGDDEWFDRMPWVPAMPGNKTYVLQEAQKEIERLRQEIKRLRGENRNFGPVWPRLRNPKKTQPRQDLREAQARATQSSCGSATIW